MRTAIFCYAPEDEQCARDIGNYLETNCPALSLSYGEAVLHSGFDLVDAMERGLSAELAIVLLSPRSVPPQWVRERWEPIVGEMRRELGGEIVFVLVEDCRYPPLFRQRVFFDMSKEPLAGKRALKRWILERGLQTSRVADIPERGAADEDITEAAGAVVDRPGIIDDISEENASALARAFAQEFESVFWIDGTHRSRTGILGDTAHALGLKMSGSEEQIRKAVRNLCSSRRFLIVYTNVAPAFRDTVRFGGMTSILFTAVRPSPPVRTLEELSSLFTSWRRNRTDCLRALGEVQYRLAASQSIPFDAVMHLGSAVVALLRDEDRLAEAHEVLQHMIAAARAAGEKSAESRLKWEQSWVAQYWDNPDPALPSIPFTSADQFAFNF